MSPTQGAQKVLLIARHDEQIYHSNWRKGDKSKRFPFEISLRNRVRTADSLSKPYPNKLNISTRQKKIMHMLTRSFVCWSPADDKSMVLATPLPA